MERMQVTAKPRTAASKALLRKFREEGFVPGIVYGKKSEPRTVAVDSKDLAAILHSPGGSNTLVDLYVDGEQQTAMIKALDRDILFHDRFTHVDFLRISLTDKLEVHVPVLLTGEAAGVKEGGVLQQPLRDVAVKCLPTEIPEHLELDVSNLGVGESLAVADLSMPPGVELITEPDEMIVTITGTRAEPEAKPDDADEEPGEEEKEEE